jgi:hypothetical protein
MEQVKRTQSPQKVATHILLLLHFDEASIDETICFEKCDSTIPSPSRQNERAGDALLLEGFGGIPVLQVPDETAATSIASGCLSKNCTAARS